MGAGRRGENRGFMYVRSAEACTVQSSSRPVPPSVVAAQRARIASTMQAWDAAQRAFADLLYGRTPDQFRDVGVPVQVEVSRNLVGVASAGRASQALTFRGQVPAGLDSSACGCRLAGPEYVPLSATSAPAERPEPVLTTVQGPTVPAVFTPAVAAIPAAAPAVRPRWGNLCFALRHGMVDESQFEPGVYAALQLRCSQLGYAGACPPPREVALYLAHGRAAGTLPYIAVSDADLAALPPVLSELGTCPESAAMGGVGLGSCGAVGRRRGLGDFRCAPALAGSGAIAPGVPAAALQWAKENPATAGGLVAGLVGLVLSGLRVRGAV